MDLLDFEAQDLYFDEMLDAEVSERLAEAARQYADGTAEQPLLRAYFLAPRSLTVLVAVYRFYYYQHRLRDALIVADRALEICAEQLGFPADWRNLDPALVDRAAGTSMTLVRFHLLSLKANAYLKLRLGFPTEGKAILQKLMELDSNNRLGARELLDVVNRTLFPDSTFPSLGQSL
jgi:hypothetical protein